MRIQTGKLCLGVCVLGLASLAYPQTVSTVGAITPAGAATAPVSGAGFEQYNSFNGALGLSIPLHHIGGRGEAGFDLVWNLQPNWVAAYNGNPGNEFLFAQQYPGTDGTNSLGLGGPGAVYVRTGYSWQHCSNGSYQPSSTVTTVTFVMPNGGQLSLLDTTSTTASSGPSRATPANYCTTSIPSQWDVSRGTSFRSTDGSQIQFNASANVEEQAPNTHGYGVAAVSGTLVFPNGVVYTVDSSKISRIQDRNGNKISLTYGGAATNIDWYLTIPALTQVNDSLGGVTSINYNYSDSSGNCSSCLGITYTGYGGATRVVKVLSGTLGGTLRSDFVSGGTKTIGALFSTSLFASSLTYNPAVTTAIVLPDNSQYSFQYNPWGEVARVTLRTGGLIDYDYAAGSGSQGGFLQSGGGVMIYRRLQTRTEWGSQNSSGSPVKTSITTHTVTYPTGKTTDTVQVEDPGNSNAVVAQTVHTFQGSPLDTLTMTATGCNSVNEGLETQTTSGYPSTLLTVTNTYSNGNSSSCQSNPQLTTVTTKNDAAQISQITYTWDSYNNVTDEKDYDWGASGPGSLLREIQTSYIYQANTGYANAGVNLIHLPSDQYIVSGSATLAHTAWRYDEQTPDAATSMIGNCSNSFNNCTLNYGPTNNLRGNITDSYQAYNGVYLLTSNSHYDVGGNLTIRCNQDNNYMFYDYTDSGGYNAFPTTIKNQLSQSSTITYDYNVGKPTMFTDPLGNVTKYQYADGLDRLTQITEPTGALQTITWPVPYWRIVFHTQVGSSSTRAEAVYDPLGRDIEDRTYTDSGHLIAVDHSYNVLGLVNGSTNPSLVTISGWTPDGLGYGTYYSYDSLGRPTKVGLPDGTSTTTSYSGNSTTFTDAASHATKTVTNLLGQVTNVYEDSAGSNLQTNYTYDAMGNLTNVLKCAAGGCSSGQSRTFSYDSLSRLTSAVNPESGTYTYSYSDGSGNNKLALQSRTDPRGNKTTYVYDAMTKLTSVTYTDGTPNSSYTYNANGQLTQSSNSNVTNNYLTFDGDGRVLTSNVVMGGVTYPFTYTYDLAGDLTKETYPSGRQLNYTYDLAQRPLTVNGVSAGVTTNYVQSVTYWPHGAVNLWQYGNNVAPVATFNKVLEPYETYSTIGNNPNNWLLYIVNRWNTNNTVGSVLELYGPGVQWNSMATLNQSYTFDNLNRLTGVTDTGYARTYHYDEFGNQSVQSYSGISPVSFAPQNNGGNPFNPATNHLVSVDAAGGYDPRGMVTKLGAGGTVQMAYDAEGNMKNTSDSGTGQSITWTFDAEGQRAQKQISGGSWTLYVHDAFGNLAAAYNNNGVTPACQTCYLSYDHLGSVRLVTDQAANIVARHDYVPFGEEIQQGAAGRTGNFFGYTTNVTQAFTGQEADGGTASLDFYNARHFAAALGSFVQPDPYNAGADILRPQSWNGYGYVLGNPLGLVDPSGMIAEQPQPEPPIDPQSGQPVVIPGGGNASHVSVLAIVKSFHGRGGTPVNKPGPCAVQRFTSAVLGVANLGSAIYKAQQLPGAVAGLSETVIGAPAAAVLAVYGTTSIVGQGLTGVAQLYSAATGNYGKPAQVAQIGSILSGPVSGLGTLVAGGSLASAERNAGYESMFTAGTGMVKAFGEESGDLIANLADWSFTYFGLQPGASGGCGSGH